MKQNINEELNYIKYLFGYKKGVVISEQETTPTIQQGGDGCELVEIKSPSFSNQQADHTKFVEPMTTKLNELITKNPAFKNGTITKMEIIGGASNVDGGVATSFSLTNDYLSVEPTDANSTGYKNNIGYARKRGELAKTTLLPILTGADYGLKIDFDPVVTPAVIDTGGRQDSNSKRKPNPGQIVIIRMTVCPTQQQGGAKEKEGKITKLSEVTSIDQIPKEFILTGSYYCNGKNSRGQGGNPNTWQPQCQNLGSDQDKNQRIASWEIKFPPNFAGNPETVPVTRWNFIWNGSQIGDITSTNFDKISQDDQVVLANLYQKQSTVETLKSMMRIASGGADTFWDKWVGPYYK
jgi:hypothetical protein